MAKMTITWTSIIKLNTSCRFDRESKRSFQIGYSVVPMGHVRSPDHQKFLGSMDTNFFFTHGALLWAQKLFYNTRLKVCTSNEAPSVIFVIVYFSHVMCQQKVGSYGFITWNLIMCNNNVTVVTEVLFIWLLPPIMWYIFTCICLTV